MSQPRCGRSDCIPRKIYDALIALEQGVVKSSDSMRAWNGTAYPYEQWNRDNDLTSAMQNSVSWYFQLLDTQMGRELLTDAFQEIAYGNADLSGGLRITGWSPR